MLYQKNAPENSKKIISDHFLALFVAKKAFFKPFWKLKTRFSPRYILKTAMVQKSRFYNFYNAVLTFKPSDLL